MVDKDNLPTHIAIIMDGNGRWAQVRGRTRTAGHREGIERVREIVRAAGELGIKAVSFFAFSSENWARPKSEVRILMRYLDIFLEREVRELNKNNVRFLVIGRDQPLPKSVLAKIRKAEQLTKDNTGTTMVLALNYGSRQEIVDGVKKFAEKVKEGKVRVEELDIDTFGNYLYTAGLPDPDLLIRTSGEMRISNFLLWQLSYAELYFPEVYWPDFKKQNFLEAIEEYQLRQRRFGGIDAR
jgi:undecaprenyl diphosphate synthase